jgi:hypothetical protein
MIAEYWIETDVERYSHDPIWAAIPVLPAETEANHEKLGKMAGFRASHLAVTFGIYICTVCAHMHERIEVWKRIWSCDYDL